MNIKKITFLAISIYIVINTTTAQTDKYPYLYKAKIIKTNNNLHSVFIKTGQLFFIFLNKDSVKATKLSSITVGREFWKFPLCWDVDNKEQYSFISIKKYATDVFKTYRISVKLLTSNNKKLLREYMIFRGSTSYVGPIQNLYYAWQRNKSARMHSFFKLHKHLYYSLIIDNPKRYLFYMTKKDSIEEYKWEFKGYWTKTNTLSQPFNSMFQAIRQNNATYIMTDSIIYKVKPDTLLRTGRIIKKPKEKETTVSNFFIDDKDTKTIFLFPPYYFIKENEEAPNIKTLKTKKKLYKSALKMAAFYLKETNEK